MVGGSGLSDVSLSLFQPYLSVLRTPAVTAPHTNFLQENSLSWGSFGRALSPE